MKVEINKRQVVRTLVVLFVSILALYGYKAFSVYRYEKKAQELRFDLITATIFSDKVTTAYEDVWRRKIEPVEVGVVVFSNSHYLGTVESALNYERKQQRDNGLLYLVDSLSTPIDKIMNSITPPPSKYVQLHACLMIMYENCNKLIMMSEAPELTESLESFSAKKKELYDLIMKAFYDSALELPTDHKLFETKNAEIKQIFLNHQKINFQKTN